MKFVMSFSCGKDSAYALNEMIKEGHELVAIIVACSKETNRSFFHGVDEETLDAYSKALGAPVIKTFADGEDYSEKFEEGLTKAKELGAELACFGDIELKSSKKWNEGRAKAAGLEPVFPLWQRDISTYVRDVVDSGFKALIKVVDLDVLPENILGKYLDADMINMMIDEDVDICGENGEYHSIVTDGPCFKNPVAIKVGKVVKTGHFAYIETSVD